MMNSFKRFSLAAVVTFFAFLSTSLAQFSGTQRPSPSTASPPLKEWTFLVYMNSDNNLYEYGFLNVMQMEKVGSSDQVNIVVQMDPEPRNLPTTRYFINKNSQAQQGKITSQVVGQLGETNMGDPKTLTDFLVWGAQNYPAKHYAVVVWNHGGGWVGVSYDDNPSAHLSTPQVRQALEGFNTYLSRSAARNGFRTAQKIDLINFDACLMSTLEVAYELKDVANYLVASQFNEPGEGEDYTNFLNPLVQKPSMTARELAEIMVYQYVQTYNTSRDINYAAVDLGRVAQFTRQFNAAMETVLRSPKQSQIKAALGSAGAFDFITGMTGAFEASTGDAKARNALDLVLQAYGYPKEGAFRLAAGKSLAANSLLNVVRSFPGTLLYRSQPNAPWNKLALQPQADGQFAAQVPLAQARQYTFVRATAPGFSARIPQEAVSTFFEKRSGTVTYHNNFPETSPLIADAYSMKTRGAHGMTLYALAKLAAQKNMNPRVRQMGNDMQSAYMQLLFASEGAPAWTKLFSL